MNQFYAHYESWEDYKNGMYRVEIVQDEEKVELSKKLLSDPEWLMETMGEVTRKWPIATAVNLTNLNCNRRAWLGWSACCLNHDASDIITRTAWNQLDNETQSRANIVAERVIRRWESSHRIKHGSQEAIEF